MNRYIDFAIRRPFTVFTILALITIILAPGMLKLKIDNSIETLMPKHDDKYIFYNKVKDTYGDNGQFVIMSVSRNDLWSAETIGMFDDLISDIEEFETYDEERERIRIQGVDAFLSEKTTSRSAILRAFDSDPVFQRTLKRKFDKLFGSTGILDRGDLKKLRNELLHLQDLKKLELIDEIASPLTMIDITGEEDTLEVYDLVEEDETGKRLIPQTEKEILLFKERLLRNPAFESALYTTNTKTGQITDFGVVIKFINVEDRDPVARELMEIIKSQKELNIASTGMPIVYVWAVNYIRSDFIVLVPLVMLVVMFIFYLNFRTLRGVILPFLSLSLAELWVLGLMGHLGFKITVMASSLPTLMIAVGSSYSIHILNQYYADFDMITKGEKRERLKGSMAHISLTVLLAGITTFIAFMMLVTSELSAVKEWGLFLSLIHI